jgi:nicotinic acid phosphoribosyltransferase
MTWATSRCKIVIKMVRCNGQPVAKLSDTPSKNMCDDEKYLAYLRQVFDIDPRLPPAAPETAPAPLCLLHEQRPRIDWSLRVPSFPEVIERLSAAL